MNTWSRRNYTVFTRVHTVWFSSSRGVSGAQPGFVADFASHDVTNLESRDAAGARSIDLATRGSKLAAPQSAVSKTSGRAEASIR